MYVPRDVSASPIQVSDCKFAIYYCMCQYNKKAINRQLLRSSMRFVSGKEKLYLKLFVLAKDIITNMHTILNSLVIVRGIRSCVVCTKDFEI